MPHACSKPVKRRQSSHHSCLRCASLLSPRFPIPISTTSLLHTTASLLHTTTIVLIISGSVCNHVESRHTFQSHLANDRLFDPRNFWRTQTLDCKNVGLSNELCGRPLQLLQATLVVPQPKPDRFCACLPMLSWFFQQLLARRADQGISGD